MAQADPRAGAIGIIGAGAAGLITAHTLLQDGFEDVQILTRDQYPGGVWAGPRVYPGLFINNVHGEFRFSPMQMPPPSNASKTGGRLSGEDMREYMETFADKFLRGKIRYGTEVLNLQRDEATTRWLVKVQDKHTGAREILEFSKIVLCTGKISPSAAKEMGFRGLVLHSAHFKPKLDDILSRVRPASSGNMEDAGTIVVVGGGKSAQDISAYLANQGRKVSIIFEITDAVLAVTRPLPDAIRKSRFLAILSPHIELRTRLERFLHTTWLGGKIVRSIWQIIAQTSLNALGIPRDSPLRRTHSMFWGIRTNDEGVGRPNGFHALVNAGKINVVAPARVEDFGSDGRSVVINNGHTLSADVVILSTGYASSWEALFTDEFSRDLGINRHPPDDDVADTWTYTSLANPPPSHPHGQQWASSIYRGLVPAKNIGRRDFAINGALFTTNNGYTFEVSAHWISSYFLGDKMRLPKSPEDALAHAERNAAWMRKRFPDMLAWTNESYSSSLSFWTWPQTVDELLDDMGLPAFRSGGNWLTWPFKVIDVTEIATLAAERRAKRDG